ERHPRIEGQGQTRKASTRSRCSRRVSQTSLRSLLWQKFYAARNEVQRIAVTKVRSSSTYAAVARWCTKWPTLGSERLVKRWTSPAMRRTSFWEMVPPAATFPATRCTGIRIVASAASTSKPSLFSTVTTVGAPRDITVQELRIECFIPTDDATERAVEA